MKITPAHDSLDYEIGKRHNLVHIEAVDEHGYLQIPNHLSRSINVGRQKQFRARVKFTDALAVRDLYRFVVLSDSPSLKKVLESGCLRNL